MKTEPHLLKKGFISGVFRGWHGFVWTLKILVPISLLTAFIQWSGAIHFLNHLVEPAMGWVRLPGMAAFPLIIGLIAGIYGGIASMALLPFTQDQMTLMAIFMLIAHNLIQEGVIQGKSGLHPLKATFFRLGAAILTVLVASEFLDPISISQETLTMPPPFSEPLLSMLGHWGIATLYLTIRIFFILMSILIFLEVLRVTGWMEPLLKGLSPLLTIMGQTQRVGLLWMAGTFFGVAYGAAVIVGEAKKGYLTKEELERLHLSIGIHHSVIEDPALFMVLGLHAFWLWVPRLMIVILFVHLLRLWQWSMKRFFH
ncbi:MAG: iron transporter [Syntrophaceae bacterium]|nr:iron transporter [Syntrophaceae bacterium]